MPTKHATKASADEELQQATFLDGLAEEAPLNNQDEINPKKEAIFIKEIDFEKEFTCKLKNLLQIANQKRNEKVTQNYHHILAFALKNKRINNKNVRDIAGVGSERARIYLNNLERLGKLTKIGQTGPGVYYTPVNNSSTDLSTD